MQSKYPAKIAVAQIDIIPGHPDLNTAKILAEISKAREAGDHIIVFPEMAVPGYLLGDEWENAAFVRDCYAYNQAIKEASTDIAVIWGNIDIDETKRGEDGRIRKYNAAFLAQNGKYVGSGCIHKTLMPKYREFDDERHFYSARKEAQDQDIPFSEMIDVFNINLNGTERKIGLILCEDMWSDDYTLSPIEVMLKKGTELIINISCSPWTWRKNNKRHRVVQQHTHSSSAYFVYANNIGIQNNGKNIFLFEGNSSIYNPYGTLHKMANNYSEEILRAEIWGNDHQSLPFPEVNSDTDKAELFDGLIFGIRKFMSNFPSKKVAIGLSGGIDSALDASLLALALGPENVYAINMPSRFNSETTKGAAYQLACNLGVNYTSISIQHVVDQTIEDVESAQFTRLDGSNQIAPLKLEGITRENLQARDRGSRVLAGTAAALGAVFVNNGNKTETAFGYATLYGDVNGAFAPIADLYKSEVYDLARYINSKKEVIPQTIFDIPASAELSENQNVDEGKGDPIYYPYHDKLVRAFVEFRLDPEDILELYLEGKLAQMLKCEPHIITGYFKDTAHFISDLEHKWRLFKINYFKRIQAPPIIAVSKRAFGFDLREAQNGVYFTRKYLEMKEKATKA
jgi:NAD+ synthase (glutamine-hydrolysing)